MPQGGNYFGVWNHFFNDAVAGADNLRNAFIQLRDGLLAAGLVQTADTGQVDVASVTWPGTNNTDAGYLMFRFDDTAQADHPIFLRVAIQRRTAVNNYSINFWIGNGSNGSGTLTTQMAFTAGSAVTNNTAYNMVISAIDGALCIAANSTNFVFILRPLLGAPPVGDTNDVQVWWPSSACGRYNTTTGQLQAPFTANLRMPGFYPLGLSATVTDADGNRIVIPCFLSFPSVGPVIHPFMVSVSTNDVNVGVLISVNSPWGPAKYYVLSGGNITQSFMCVTSNTTLAIFWELDP